MNMMKNPDSTGTLAASITKAASMQTYLTIRLLADRDRTADAYRAYAYFRWVDDTLDAPKGSRADRREFLQRQQALLAGCYRNDVPAGLLPEEKMLAELVGHDPDRMSGLHTYLQHMMKVMAFDTERRGRLINGSELNDYTRYLASAVTEAIHYFIGHDCRAPQGETRYMAVNAAHITHMMRDTLDDVQRGYFNTPREVLESMCLSPGDVSAPAYRAWVRQRVELAREYFEAGRGCLYRIKNLRCRLAELAYISRFESVLDVIERDGYLLRETYPELKPASAMWKALLSYLGGFTARHREYLASSRESGSERSFRRS